MGYVIIYLIVGFICGFICSAIASSRGMEGGFWWGFWLGIIGIIIVAVRPNDNAYTNSGKVASKAERIHYCNKCKGTFSGPDGINCPRCSIPLLKTQVLLSDWQTFTSDKKEQLKQAFSEGKCMFGGPEYNWDNVVPVGGWRCKKCGRANQGYVSVCSCGTKKDEAVQEKETKNFTQGSKAQIANYLTEADRIKHLKEYKELLDAGIITQEEFEKKKTQLLWENTVETDVEIDNDNNAEAESKKATKKDGDFDGINPKGEKAVYLLPAYRDDYGTCPKCGSTQPKGRHVCWKCSVPLMYDPE